MKSKGDFNNIKISLLIIMKSAYQKILIYLCKNNLKRITQKQRFKTYELSIK